MWQDKVLIMKEDIIAAGEGAVVEVPGAGVAILPSPETKLFIRQG